MGHVLVVSMLLLCNRRLGNIVFGSGLLFPHGEISTLEAQEFLMCATFHNLSLMNHDNLI